jgi:hypothetical protein
LARPSTSRLSSPFAACFLGTDAQETGNAVWMGGLFLQTGGRVGELPRDLGTNRWGKRKRGGAEGAENEGLRAGEGGRLGPFVPLGGDGRRCPGLVAATANSRGARLVCTRVCFGPAARMLPAPVPAPDVSASRGANLTVVTGMRRSLVCGRGVVVAERGEGRLVQAAWATVSVGETADADLCEG